jgi:ABC-2 type transport system ATP-binding protein
MMLQAKGLVFRYPGGFMAGPLDLDLGPGIHHLVGPNGSGKTTLLRCLAADLPRHAGWVRVLGADPHRDHIARRHIALVPAQPDLPDFLTVDEAWQQLAALRAAPNWDGHALREALELPGGLALRHCSAGQRRRAELLAGMAGDPAVLLLDETPAHLDVASQSLLVSWLEAWRANRVVVLVHHGEPPVAVDSTVVVGAKSPSQISSPQPGESHAENG